MCAVIPVFNHWQRLEAVIDVLQEHDLHCFLVDDGSDVNVRHHLQAIVQNRNSITLFSLSWNQGKGAAVMEGLMRAYKAGFTHAVQIDADGQHDCDALGRLLAESERYPMAVVSGLPEYDSSIPKPRLYGRYVTRFWVWVETLSTEIKDAMVGFRVYPLEAASKLIKDVDLTRRMDFDIEILVRLYWAGISVRTVPVKILYPSDGVSHFKVAEDNVRISLLHSRLFFGMLRRFFLLMKRKVARNRSFHWSRMQERGSECGIRLLLGIYRLLGHKVFSMVLWPVMLYFFITGRQARNASLDYLQKLYRQSPLSLERPPDWRMSLQHFVTFGFSLADRFKAWLGNISLSDIDVEGDQVLFETMAEGRGVIFLVSHHGNIDLCRALNQLQRKQKALKINVLVSTHHALVFNKVMSGINPEVSVRLIEVSDIGSDTSMMLSDIIDRGEIVAIAADRLPITGYSSHVVSPFLGEQACFPKGPFILASVLSAPVFTLFCSRKPNGRFLLSIELFSERLLMPRRERQQQLERAVELYAKRLEDACMASPLEWFNFFDFWRLCNPSSK